MTKPVQYSIGLSPPKPGRKLHCVHVKGHPDPACDGKYYRPHAEAFELFKSFAFPDEQPVARNTKTRAVKAKAKRKAAKPVRRATQSKGGLLRRPFSMARLS